MNTTKHNHTVVFGRRVAGCPRCEELKNGAAPVKGWGQRANRYGYPTDAQKLRAIKAHFAPGGRHEEIMKTSPCDVTFDW